MRILVSACLLGVCCRYDGQSKPSKAVMHLAETHEIIPVCPEQLGGLATPRPPAEIQGVCVRMETGGDVTAQYQRGAEEAARLYALLHCDLAILKSRSPSCGLGKIYDGSFSGTLAPGNGMTARLMLEKGMRVISDEEAENGLPQRKVL